MDPNNEINFRSLKRYDPSVESILTSATQVAVYNYVSKDWNKADIEGALHVVAKKGTNNYALIIMNRLSTVNFNETINRKWEITLNLPFLLYKNDKDEIRCVWFYDQADCKRVYSKLNEIMTSKDTTNDLKNGLNFAKLSLQINSSANNGNCKPVEETLAKLGIKQTATNDKEEFVRNLIMQKNQKTLINNDSLETTRSPTIFNDKSLPNLPSTPATQSRTLNLQELFDSTSKPSVINNLTQSFAEKIEMKTPNKSMIESTNNDASNDLVLTPALLKQNGSNAKFDDHRRSSPPMLSSQQPDQLFKPMPQINSEFVSPFQAKLLTAVNPQSSNILTMEQLKQTLIHLLSNDADFLHTIHTAYAQSVQTKFY